MGRQITCIIDGCNPKTGRYRPYKKTVKVHAEGKPVILTFVRAIDQRRMKANYPVPYETIYRITVIRDGIVYGKNGGKGGYKIGRVIDAAEN